MLKYIQGDVTSPEVLKDFEAFIHNANCQNTMRSGVAKYVSSNLPELVNADKQTAAGDMNKLGTFSSAKIERDGMDLVGFNAYGQYYYGTDKQHLDYMMLERSLAAIGKETKGKRVVLPRIGCGLAGGSWEVIEPMIAWHLRDSDVTICDI